MTVAELKDLLDQVSDTDAHVYFHDEAQQQVVEVNGFGLRKTLKWKSMAGFDQFSLTYPNDDGPSNGEHWVIT